MSFRVLLLICLSFLLASCGEYEEREREVGYKGIAKVNHLLAAERLANELGLKTSSYAGAPALPPPPQTTLMLPAESLQSEGQLEEITDWILDGGNLVVYLTLKNEHFWGIGANEDESFQAFLDYFSLEIESSYRREDLEEDGELKLGTQIDSLSYEGGDSYVTDFRSPYLISDLDYEATPAKAFHSYDYGEGTLTVLASAQLFTNEFIGKAEHATLFWEVLSSGKEDQVWIVYSTRVSFFKLLWEHAAQAVVFLLVTLVLLVWWAARGFGPKFVRGTNPSAKLDEHLEASGSFFLKHKAEGVVIENLRERLLRKLARVTRQPFNLSAGELVSVGREQDLIDSSESSALTQLVSDKNLLETLQILKNLDKKL